MLTIITRDTSVRGIDYRAAAVKVVMLAKTPVEVVINIHVVAQVANDLVIGQEIGPETVHAIDRIAANANVRPITTTVDPATKIIRAHESIDRDHDRECYGVRMRVRDQVDERIA